MLDAETFDAWASQPGAAMVVFAEDPDRYKETLDLAVIVPELHAARAGAFRVALLPPAAARALAPRYGFARWPAFVMLRDGQYVGAVDGIRDWDVYIAELDRLLAAEPTRPPTVGIPVKRGGRAASPLPLTTRRSATMRPVNIPIRSLMAEPDDARRVHADAARDDHLRDAATARARARATTSPARATCWRPSSSHFGAWLDDGGEPPALDLAGLAPDTLRVLNETLGEGEVAAIVDAGHEIRIQETVFSGVWREQHFDAGGALLHDYLLAAPIPPLVAALAARTRRADAARARRCRPAR